MPATKDTTTVRITRDAHEKLRVMADEDEVSLTEELDHLIEKQRRNRFIERANRQYAALKEDKEAWNEMMEERRELEGTLMDGLKDLDDEWSQTEPVEENA